MQVRRAREFRVIRWLGWCSALAAISAAGMIVLAHRRSEAEAVVAVRERQNLRLAAARQAVEHYFADVWMCLQIVSVDPYIANLNSGAQPHLQLLFDANYARRRLTEIYVIERNFDGRRRPFMTFEKEDDKHRVSAIHPHEREIEEYAVQMEHIRCFAADPGLESLLSDPVRLCVGKPGIVCSVPIRSQGNLVGIVAGMVPLECIREVLEASSLDNTLLLANEHGAHVGCADFAASGSEPWFAEQFKAQGIRRFFESRPPAFLAGQHHAIWSPVAIPGDRRRWYVALLYDEAAYVHPGLVSGEWAAWGTAGIVVLLGGAVFFLCRAISAAIAARQEADARARDLVESEERAQQHQAELAHVLRLGTMGEIASHLAHELNQPLAAIVNYISACSARIRAGAGRAEEWLDDMKQAVVQAKRAGDVVERIRDFTRVREPRRTRGDVNAIVREAAELMNLELRYQKGQVRLELGDALPIVAADPTQVEQVVVNLMRNGLDAMAGNDPNARRLTIRTSKNASGWIECAVEDMGTGFPDDAVGRMFEPFYTTKPNGMGMGLSISRTIIESHGGRLWAAPTPGGGATFRFTLPVADREVKDGS